MLPAMQRSRGRERRRERHAPGDDGEPGSGYTPMQWVPEAVVEPERETGESEGSGDGREEE